MPGRADMSLASMGNYIFKTKALVAALEEDAPLEASAHDFGRDIIPSMVAKGASTYVYDFQQNVVPGEDEGHAYWRDIGTVEAYWAAQLDLVAIQPAFNLYNHRWPIRTGISHDPPAKFVFRDEAAARVGIATESLVSLGCIVSGGRIHRSVLSNRVRVNSFSHIEDSVLFENVVIGRHVKIRRAIIDKDVEIPSNTEIGYNLEEDRKRWYVSEGGIVVIPKRAKIDSP
jgi:glucose-1-phosphate adenylyltransferase